MTAEHNETLSRAAQSRGENMMIDRACEVFIEARKALGDDLSGQCLVERIEKDTGYPIDACRELAAIVVDRCVCSERLKEKYCDGVEIPSRLLELARIAYHGYGASVSFKAYNGESMPAWDELPDRIKAGWRGSVVELLLEYQAGNGSVRDPGETVKDSENYFVTAGNGISMRVIKPAGEPGQPRRMIIERDIHGNELSDGVERLSLNQAEALELSRYIARTHVDDFWRD